MHQWLYWNTAHFSPACGGLLFERAIKQMFGAGDPDPDKIAESTENFKRFASVLDEHLQQSGFLIGDNATVADHSTGSFLVHAELGGYTLEDYPNVAKWWEGLVSSEAWQKALSVIPRD